jgi:hypothetical protein
MSSAHLHHIAVSLRQSAATLADQSKRLAALAEALQMDAPAAERSQRVLDLDDLRRLKPKNVSWKQVIRGGLADVGRTVTGLRRSDKSHARRLAREAGLTTSELVEILEVGGITPEDLP